jgi:hypothetical protein
MWAATSPTPLLDYDWETWVDVGGFPVLGHELNDVGGTVKRR